MSRSTAPTLEAEDTFLRFLPLDIDYRRYLGYRLKYDSDASDMHAAVGPLTKTVSACSDLLNDRHLWRSLRVRSSFFHAILLVIASKRHA